MIDEEIADAIYSSAKRDRDVRLNSEIKDRVRAYDVVKISHFLLEVMAVYQGDSDKEGLLRQCLSVIGQWIGIFQYITQGAYFS